MQPWLDLCAILLVALVFHFASVSQYRKWGNNDADDAEADDADGGGGVL